MKRLYFPLAILLVIQFTLAGCNPVRKGGFPVGPSELVKPTNPSVGPLPGDPTTLVPPPPVRRRSNWRRSNSSVGALPGDPTTPVPPPPVRQR